MNLHTCIYCLSAKPSADFKKVEHVVPRSFGTFHNNLTLINVVCDVCNSHFGETLELYLARDTFDGLNRFRVGGKSASEYRSLGRASSMRGRIAEGPLAGVPIVQRADGDELKAEMLPQVAFGTSRDGPFELFDPDDLPDKDQLISLFSRGYCHLEFLNMEDEQAAPVLQELQKRGAQTMKHSDERPSAWLGKFRTETKIPTDDRLIRVLAKVALNYLASQYGAEFARSPALNIIRRFIRYGTRPPWDELWIPDQEPIAFGLPSSLGHVVGVSRHPANHCLVGYVSFHLFARYRVLLAPAMPELPDQRFGRAHFFDSTNRSIVPLTAAQL